MKLEIVRIGEYQLIRIEEELNVISDLEELYLLVKGYVEQGKQKIAVSFPNASYIYSGAIAVLMKCVKAVNEWEGELCIIEPNADIRGILTTINVLNKVIKAYDSEADLLKCGVRSREWGVRSAE